MKLVIAGVSGRMGRMLVAAADAAEGVDVAAALVRPGHDWVGHDLGRALGGAERGVIVTGDAGAALGSADALIDFTAPDATLAYAQEAARRGVAHVIGTTGFDADQIATLEAGEARNVTVRAGNMSLGVNLLTQLVRQVAAALGEEFDIEIVERHHRHKVDAPSGTALMLGEAAAEGRGVAIGDVSDRGRDGITGPRRAGDIGFAAIRGGDIVGMHDVVFAGPGEIVTLSHMATDRSLFARGAVRAALWAQDRPAGRYDMLDVLGIG
ncbi:dihydrodipicolinate reductase [Palleronia aestuarii]|uniref:4-hydroxy-tetrahydrodipicolinate reductase n=1 Tax=Palleronia aestuarii TaxID=568105 RepID=A0A2W7NCE1_9RHOB|nr:4-hydroxy-tetrahydrodipicolinate reductase [Palleronia aestuarii]PZX15817.1 dihydrodipicolinate reductase [Palleronia aestuarii]